MPRIEEFGIEEFDRGGGICCSSECGNIAYTTKTKGIEPNIFLT